MITDADQRAGDIASDANAPADFVRGRDSLRRTVVRPDVDISPMKAPQRLAPYSYALGAEVIQDDTVLATGRLVLLSDPDSHLEWDGSLRLITYASAELDADMGADPMLSEVGWSWLVDGLESHGARFHAAGGTVTRTSSARFGDLAGPPAVVELELRASWTPSGDDLGPHLLGWATMLATAAGLPPPGVSLLADHPAPNR